MITKEMTDNEIVKELQFIEDILMSRLEEYCEKFERKLKSAAYGHNAVLDMQEDVINGNKVIICFQKLVYADQLYDLRVSKLVLTENYAFLSVRDDSGDFFYIRFTYHASGRMCERSGMMIKDFFVNEFVGKAGASMFLIKYEEHGKTDFTYIMTIGECYFIVEIHGNRIDVVTDLEWDMLHPNQMALYVNSKRCAETFASNTYDRDAATLKGVGLKKTSDLVKAIFD